jgi:glyoxalase family protein
VGERVPACARQAARVSRESATAGPGAVLGLHHVTAIAGDPKRNLRFYTQVLGLRFVKWTVNFDDPGTYHLYYGDELGRPGTALTFFPWPGAPRGRRGAGRWTAVAFSVPERSLGYWRDRLAAHGLGPEDADVAFGEERLAFLDPDGLRLELVAVGDDPREPWARGLVPPEHAIRGLHRVTLLEAGYEAIARLLAEGMGLRPVAEQGARARFAAGPGGPGALVDPLAAPDAPPGLLGVGTVHHVAWRVVDEEALRSGRAALVARGVDATRVIDRLYFRSVYFRGAGGEIFEIATAGPGFTVDESPDALGSALRLPPWLEPYRRRIEAGLPPLHVPGAA